jgi:tetratricopeptide (TPR) repeat protein
MKMTLAVLMLSVLACGSRDDRLDRAERDLEAGLFVEVRQSLTQAYGSVPGPVRAALLLARAQRECGNVGEARNLLDRLRGPDAELPAVVEEKVRVLLALAAKEKELGRKRAAAVSLGQAGQFVRVLVKSGRAGPDVLLLAADVEIGLGRRGPARNWIEEARVSDASVQDAETREIMVLAQSGARQDAVTRFEALLAKHGENAAALYALGSLVLAGGEEARGRQHLERAIRADPMHPQAAVRLAKLFLESGKAKDAIETVRPHLELRPDDLSGLLVMGRALAAAERWPEAVETMRHAVRVHDDEPAVMNNLGVTLYEGSFWKNEWLDDAIRTHEMALRVAPRDVMNGYNLCRCLTKRRSPEDLKRAVAIYERLLVYARGNPKYWALRLQMHGNAALILSDTLKLFEEAYRHYIPFFEMGGKGDKGILDDWGNVLDGLGLPFRAPPPPNPEKHR